MKPILSEVSLHKLLKGIAQIQPVASQQQREPVLRLLKEAIETLYPDHIVTWTSITRTRTEAVAENLVCMKGYAHTLTSDGEGRLAMFEASEIPVRIVANV